ncbi:RnfH family protein [Ferrimonas senticii]|uniref:RnfH family protein n=1 Tax=Ferrimonas senticii TaxID=394566 RepID=UPI0003F5873E|nr:RnfH family protein [Ferrimonas senticii]
MSQQMLVEVVYALPSEAFVRKVTLPEGATAQQAIEASGVLQRYPEIDLAKQKIGIFSNPVKPMQVLNEGDRVEIYRPLLADPREVRKRRAEKAKAEGRADAVTGGRPNPQRADKAE